MPEYEDIFKSVRENGPRPGTVAELGEPPKSKNANPPSRPAPPVQSDEATSEHPTGVTVVDRTVSPPVTRQMTDEEVERIVDAIPEDTSLTLEELRLEKEPTTIENPSRSVSQVLLDLESMIVDVDGIFADVPTEQMKAMLMDLINEARSCI